jgi:hypothetical protein
MHQPHDLYLLRSVTSRLPSVRPDAALLRPGARDSSVSQKMLAQQLRQLERDGIVARIVHPAFGLLQAPGLAVRNLYRVPGPGQHWQRADPVRMTDFPESGLFLDQSAQT